ncbi:hypothetical protein ES705_24350 [subsurface metagenome]
MKKEKTRFRDKIKKVFNKLIGKKPKPKPKPQGYGFF